jgi:hypothetical protein
MTVLTPRQFLLATAGITDPGGARIMARTGRMTEFCRRHLILALGAVVVGLLAWPLLGRRSGAVDSILKIPSSGPIGAGLASFPSIGEVRWVAYPERPPRIRITGKADVRRCYRWIFGRDMPVGDRGMGVISPPHPPGEIGQVGDSYYESDGNSGVYHYNMRMLLDGSFQMDLCRRR